MKDFKEGRVSVCITDWSCYGNEMEFVLMFCLSQLMEEF